jgi:NADH-quinone oxidoreductase subunit I/NAD(P)H-quinone oxidoreductase subunit I
VKRYFADIGRAVSSTVEGLSVTMSWLFRRPLTIQYPDKIEKPVQEMLPDGYRGLLEVDLRKCIGCLICTRSCPIGALQTKVEKNAATGVREIVQFDIDIGRCMYCGLCSEACNFGALRHTPDFEATASRPEDLVLHFAREPVPVSKDKAGEGPPRRPLGTILVDVVPPCLGRKRWPGRAVDGSRLPVDGGDAAVDSPRSPVAGGGAPGIREPRTANREPEES